MRGQERPEALADMGQDSHSIDFANLDWTAGEYQWDCDSHRRSWELPVAAGLWYSFSVKGPVVPEEGLLFPMRVPHQGSWDFHLNRTEPLCQPILNTVGKREIHADTS